MHDAEMTKEKDNTISGDIMIRSWHDIKEDSAYMNITINKEQIKTLLTNYVSK